MELSWPLEYNNGTFWYEIWISNSSTKESSTKPFSSCTVTYNGKKLQLVSESRDYLKNWSCEKFWYSSFKQDHILKNPSYPLLDDSKMSYFYFLDNRGLSFLFVELHEFTLCLNLMILISCFWHMYCEIRDIETETLRICHLSLWSKISKTEIQSLFGLIWYLPRTE